MDRNLERERRLAGLMRSAQDGNRSAYFELLQEITPLLRASVRRHYAYLQQADVEDLVQDILLSLHTVRATYEPERPFVPWLLGIARNRAADAARRYGRRAANETGIEDWDVTFAEAETNTPVESYRDPEALRAAVRQLPVGQRQAIEMLKLREMSLREAAAATGMSIGALKVAAHRGVSALRKALAAGS